MFHSIFFFFFFFFYLVWKRSKTSYIYLHKTCINPVTLNSKYNVSFCSVYDDFCLLSTAPKPEKQEPKQFVCCDYCGEMFDTRKALSCHARGHLRQLGARWSLKVPPIEALYELMRREGTERVSQIKSEPASGAAEQWRKTASSPQTLTLSPGEKEKLTSDSMSTGTLNQLFFLIAWLFVS